MAEELNAVLICAEELVVELVGPTPDGTKEAVLVMRDPFEGSTIQGVQLKIQFTGDLDRFPVGKVYRGTISICEKVPSWSVSIADEQESAGVQPIRAKYGVKPATLIVGPPPKPEEK